MRITKDMRVGDIYLNPVMEDLWILRQDYIEDLDHEQWVLSLVHSDYTEDYRCVKGFIKIGNIYEVFGRIDKAIGHLEELSDNTDDTTCYEIDRTTRKELISMLRGEK